MNSPTAAPAPYPHPARLKELARRAIAASTDLTSACSAGKAISDAHYARIDQAASETRRQLLECLARDHGIDAAMADRLGALL